MTMRCPVVTPRTGLRVFERTNKDDNEVQEMRTKCEMTKDQCATLLIMLDHRTEFWAWQWRKAVKDVDMVFMR